MKRLLPLLVGLAAASSRAEEHLHVCARAPDGKMYSVQATLVTGQELIQRTNNLSYQSFAKYVAIFWDKDRVSLINIGGVGGLSAIPIQGPDQQGRIWQVSSADVCY